MFRFHRAPVHNIVHPSTSHAPEVSVKTFDTGGRDISQDPGRKTPTLFP